MSDLFNKEKITLDKLAERAPTGELPQIPDKTNVEVTADIHIPVKNLLEGSSEQKREIISLLSKGYNQSEFAIWLGVPQRTVSRKVSKFKKFLSAGV